MEEWLAVSIFEFLKTVLNALWTYDSAFIFLIAAPDACLNVLT